MIIQRFDDLFAAGLVNSELSDDEVSQKEGACYNLLF